MHFEPVDKDGNRAVSLSADDVEAVMEPAGERRMTMAGDAACGAFVGDFLMAPDESWYMTMDHACERFEDGCAVKQFLVELGGENFRPLNIV